MNILRGRTGSVSPAPARVRSLDISVSHQFHDLGSGHDNLAHVECPRSQGIRRSQTPAVVQAFIKRLITQIVLHYICR